MRDGLCPSCRGDMSAPKLQPLTTVQVRLGAELPALCVACGQKTPDTIEVARAMTEGGHAWPIKILAYLVSPLMAALANRDLEGKRRDVAVTLPFCAACRNSRPAPAPTFVNYERFELDFIVHDDFADAFRRERAGQ